MSSRMESSHVQNPKGFPGRFSCESEHHTEKCEHNIRYIMYNLLYETFINSTAVLQKRAIRIMNNVGYSEHKSITCYI